MGDPRNVAHAKKVTQEKQHKARAAPKTRAPQPGKKAQIEETKSAATEQSTPPKSEAEKPLQPPDSSKLEKSLAVLSNLKELEFHSRANIEKLAELSLTIEEELKQKAFAEGIGAVYGAQDAFQSNPRIDRSLRDRVHSLVGFGLTSWSVRILFSVFSRR